MKTIWGVPVSHITAFTLDGRTWIETKGVEIHDNNERDCLCAIVAKPVGKHSALLPGDEITVPLVRIWAVRS